MSSPSDAPNQMPDLPSSIVREDTIEYGLIGTLQKLKYEYRPDITNRATLEANFREKFEPLNRVRLTDAEFAPACWMRSSPRMSSPPPRLPPDKAEQRRIVA